KKLPERREDEKVGVKTPFPAWKIHTKWLGSGTIKSQFERYNNSRKIGKKRKFESLTYCDDPPGLFQIGSLKIHARPCYFRLAEEAVRQDQIVMRPRICADDLTGVAVVTDAAYHLVRQNVFCERNLGCSEVERAPACSAIIGILDRFTESVLTIGNSIDVVILGYLRWDQEPGDFPYRSSIWKYWNRPKIKSQNGASEKLTHITQNHFQNMCLCVRLSNHYGTTFTTIVIKRSIS
ncbi:unnamed protein product, partial [Nesidiocoris tenuis]